MNAEKFEEMESRSALGMLQEAERNDAIRRMEAHARVHDVIAAMKEEGKALELTEEEERLLRSFRRFKISCKPGAVFKWQTRPDPAGVVLAEETGLVRDPQECAPEPTR